MRIEVQYVNKTESINVTRKAQKAVAAVNAVYFNVKCLGVAF